VRALEVWWTRSSGHLGRTYGCNGGRDLRWPARHGLADVVAQAGHHDLVVRTVRSARVAVWSSGQLSMAKPS